MPSNLADALHEATKIAEWLELAKPQAIEDADDRKVLASAFFLIALEHHLAILRLFHHRLPSSGFALARPQVDAYIRGEWASKVASEDELRRFQDGTFDPSPDTIIKRLRAKYPEIGDPLEQIKRLAWSRWSGFTHGGHAQLCNWVSDGAVGPVHTEDSCVRVIRLASTFAFLSALSLCELTGTAPEPFFAQAMEFGLTKRPSAC